MYEYDKRAHPPRRSRMCRESVVTLREFSLTFLEIKFSEHGPLQQLINSLLLYLQPVFIITYDTFRCCRLAYEIRLGQV